MISSAIAREKNRILLATVAVSLMLPTIAVQAAEVMLPTTVRPQPWFGAPQSFPRWNGWYVGAGLGTETLKLDDDVFTRGRWGFSGQVFAGYDMQFRTWGQRLVAGAFADFNYSGAKTKVASDLAAIAWDGHLKQTWSGDVGARVGWVPDPKLLVYVSAGASFGWAEAELRDPWFGAIPRATDTGIGWFGGIGAEGEIARHVTLRGEYRYGQMDFSGSTLTTQRAMLGVAWRR